MHLYNYARAAILSAIMVFIELSLSGFFKGYSRGEAKPYIREECASGSIQYSFVVVNWSAVRRRAMGTGRGYGLFSDGLQAHYFHLHFS
jgi:hypothetical protein